MPCRSCVQNGGLLLLLLKKKSCARPRRCMAAHGVLWRGVSGWSAITCDHITSCYLAYCAAAAAMVNALRHQLLQLLGAALAHR